MLASVQVPDVTFFWNGEMSKDKAVIFIRTHPDVKDAVEAEAKRKQMSTNLWLEELLCRELDLNLEHQMKVMTRAAGQVA